MDAENLAIAAELLAERNRLHLLLDALANKRPVLFVMPEFGLEQLTPIDRCQGIATDIRLRLVAVEDDLTMIGVTNLPKPMTVAELMANSEAA